MSTYFDAALLALCPVILMQIERVPVNFLRGSSVAIIFIYLEAVPLLSFLLIFKQLDHYHVYLF